MTENRIAWFRWSEVGATSQLEHPLCETERHEGQGIRAEYVMVMVGPLLGEWYEGDQTVYGICAECCEIIAGDLGTTAESGALTH